MKKSRGRPTANKGPMNPPAGLDEPVALTLRDVSRYLHCHYMTVYHLVRAGALPAFRLGSDFRVWRADLEKWIAAGGGGKSASAPTKATRGLKHEGKREGRRVR
jgi:excisionase family DNA binding protein